MPAVNFTVSWPDGETREYYSPSTIVHQYLKAGVSYSQAEFAELCQHTMTQASERVRQRYGFACSASSAELEKLQRKLKTLRERNIEGTVAVIELR
ncbi:MSMEG_0570 family nitrogen starvation response protein [Zhongshania borealis]|uniref:MSMEG_0570 family nitrogen starvation response protein n=1 Tax=Zhongshania borealis TaxID=889488 RepID=A0ABP7W6R2_9GAMM